ncbi:Thermostable carboxypeptidase 1 [Thalassovita gelatinovora]|uniref:Metal-dependent carboxypeptidase n=1 Tax=Thalassovita gelatinovora TaxID=53501 RepID=A0A0N7LWB3_THAGE|nr:carboxypeptidase M32 [Thalassovita gelatinovora]QIZ79036.1 carboxypeptidase M32 [Thalassovita gelatinovora]CUH68618.1 Thermostable carboxypeptidase 1 [Thalassovita gelatinovora]SEQ55594.1 carboxypeptidase Taq Metallo peptidase. MEROPS family M32 [Thalassovita gelatinovora]
MSTYDDLMAFQRDTSALAQVAGRLGWDQETMMPRGAADQRSDEMAAMEKVLHARRTDPKLAEWLAAIDDTALDPVGQAQMRHIRKSYDRAMKVPADLAVEIAKVTSKAQGQWAQARADEDVAAFLPVLETVVGLKRREGEALADGGDVYDAMIDDYEPEMTAVELATMFDAMRPRLVALREAVLAAEPPQAVTGHFPADKQMALAAKLATTFGYDLTHGRIDKAVHPFSSGSGHDVRITTRTSELDPFNCFYSTIHEVGHACYEQNIDDAYLLTPLGGGVSMGVHESQSRIYENQLGRSRAFTGWLYGQMTAAFGDFGINSAEDFYRTVNRVHDGYIRTEADEVQYNLHVMLRFDLERALMQGDLAVFDLEAAWNDRFAADFGYAVDKPSNGCLQDVHWSVGLFGYFPTYSLGNVYAGCLYQALQGAVPGLDEQLTAGDLSAATEWLKDNLQIHGGLFEPAEVVQRASGIVLSPEPLLTYLEGKFGAIYQL